MKLVSNRVKFVSRKRHEEKIAEITQTHQDEIGSLRKDFNSLKAAQEQQLRELKRSQNDLSERRPEVLPPGDTVPKASNPSRVGASGSYPLHDPGGGKRDNNFWNVGSILVGLVSVILALIGIILSIWFAQLKDLAEKLEAEKESVAAIQQFLQDTEVNRQQIARSLAALKIISGGTDLSDRERMIVERFTQPGPRHILGSDLQLDQTERKIIEEWLVGSGSTQVGYQQVSADASERDKESASAKGNKEATDASPGGQRP